MSDPTLQNGHQPLSLITVVYEAELALLRLQARSMARFMPKADVLEILIVLNDRDPAALQSKIAQNLDDWGIHAQAVRFVDPADIFYGPKRLGDWPKALQLKLKGVSRRLRNHPATSWAGASGWLIQQAMKLAAARAASGTQLVILDAKNHLVGDAAATDFFTPSGAALARLEKVKYDSFEWHQSARAFLGMDALEQNEALAPSITPYCATKADVLVTLAEIEARRGSIEYFFKPKSPRGTEFTLLSSVQMREGALADGVIPYASLLRDATPEDVQSAINKAEQGEVRMLGTHSAILAKMDPEIRARLVSLWQSRGLVDDSIVQGIFPDVGNAE